MDKDVLLWIFGCGVGIIGTLLGIIWKSLSNQVCELQKKEDSISNRITALETKIEIFWRALSEKAASVLHSPHTPKLDMLLERYNNSLLTNEELKELITMLNEIERSEEDKATKLAAVILLLTIKMRYHL
jgi:hypothetical protein